MLNANRAERILSRGTTPERAAAIVGDLAEEARTRGTLWFWFHVFRTALSQMRLSEEQRLSLIFGLIGGGMWMGLLILGNLGGTAVLGNIRDNHPRVYGATRYFALVGLLVPVMTGLSAAYRMGGSMRAALRAGLLSGFISGVMCLLTIVPMTIVFHDAMMLDPSNIREFARGAGRIPSQAELSHFLYWDALGGGLNMLWVGPLLGFTLSTLGAFFGKAMFRGDQKRAA
jgi:hypothetical protein